MKKLKSIDGIHQQLHRPSFTAKEAKEFGMYPALIGYYIKKGKLQRIARGIYRSCDYQGSPANFQWEDLIEAVHSVPGGIICLISALALYGITEEIPRQHWIGVSHNTSIKREKAIKIIRFRNIELGKTKLKLGGISVPIFDRERTVVDSFRLLSLETAIKALKMALSKKGSLQLDLQKLQDYAKKLKINITPYLITAMT